MQCSALFCAVRCCSAPFSALFGAAEKRRKASKKRRMAPNGADNCIMQCSAELKGLHPFWTLCVG
eukprot:7968568-Alexandrium_andersonii.AAC.1